MGGGAMFQKGGKLRNIMKGIVALGLRVNGGFVMFQKLLDNGTL